MTIIRAINYASIAFGAIGAFILYKVEYEHFGDAVRDIASIKAVGDRNQRRQRWRQFGFGLIMLSVALQVAAQFAD
jgi:hypothetical protein